jgi:hypothetical protein
VNCVLDGSSKLIALMEKVAGQKFPLDFNALKFMAELIYLRCRTGVMEPTVSVNTLKNTVLPRLLILVRFVRYALEEIQFPKTSPEARMLSSLHSPLNLERLENELIDSGVGGSLLLKKERDCFLVVLRPSAKALYTCLEKLLRGEHDSILDEMLYNLPKRCTDDRAVFLYTKLNMQVLVLDQISKEEAEKKEAIARRSATEAASELEDKFVVVPKPLPEGCGIGEEEKSTW